MILEIQSVVPNLSNGMFDSHHSRHNIGADDVHAP